MIASPFSREGIFPFLKLPAELRRRILSFTNLIVPERDITCSVFDGFGIPEQPIKQMACLLQDFDGDYCLLNPLSDFRFCARFANAYSRHCHCWFPERSIMKCNKQLYREAMEVFLDMNTFAKPCPSWLQLRRLEPSARKPMPKEPLQRWLSFSDSSSTVMDGGY